jgi:hypothetical protein
MPTICLKATGYEQPDESIWSGTKGKIKLWEWRNQSERRQIWSGSRAPNDKLTMNSGLSKPEKPSIRDKRRMWRTFQRTSERKVECAVDCEQNATSGSALTRTEIGRNGRFVKQINCRPGPVQAIRSMLSTKCKLETYLAIECDRTHIVAWPVQSSKVTVKTSIRSSRLIESD